MDAAARRYARWVLLIHLLLLLLVGALVVAAAREVRDSARRQAVQQEADRLRLVARQTSAGIRGFYSSILDNLDLVRESEEAGQTVETGRPRLEVPRAAQAMLVPDVMWRQLRGRCSHLIVVEPRRLDVIRSFKDANAADPARIIAQASDWLRAVTEPSVSPLMVVDGMRFNLAVAPSARNRLAIVAVIPVESIERSFFADLNAHADNGAMLLDAAATVMICGHADIEGRSLLADDVSPELRSITRRYVTLGKGGAEEVAATQRVGDVEMLPAIVAIEPIDVRGQRWWLSVASGLARIDAVQGELMGRLIRWAVFVAISVTAILVSTAVQMIRARARMERVQHDLLQREIEQARQIQLSWLPQRGDRLRDVEIAAINRPANHISGDFYNWFTLPDGRHAVVIGDVSGHGMAAAFLMATTQLLVRAALERFGDPAMALEDVNRQISAERAHGQFVTMQVVVIDASEGLVEIATAGHPPPLACRAGRTEPLPLEPELVLGVERRSEYRTQRFSFAGGGAILLYTDGATDVVNPDGKRFCAELLRDTVCPRPRSADELLAGVLAGVDAFRREAELNDDLTLVAIRLPAAQPGELESLHEPAEVT